MDWAWLGFYLATMLALGTAGTLLFADYDKGLVSRTLGLIVVLGAGALGYGLFLFGLLGARPGRGALAVLCAIGLAGSGYLFRRRRISLRELGSAFSHSAWRYDLGSSAVLVLLVVFQIVVLTHALGFPLYEWDAYATWGLKAKAIAVEGIVPRPAYFSDVSLSYSHLDYPLMVPFLMAGVHGVLGRVDDQLAKLALPVLYFGLACLIFAFSKRRLPNPLALAVTALVVGAPVTLRWAGSGNADLPLAAFYTASVILLLEWTEDPDWRTCAACGVMSAFAAFTKNEGLALGALNCAVVLLLLIRSAHRKRALAGAGLCVAVFLLMIVPWVVWSSDLPRTHENYPAHLSLDKIAGNASRIPIIIAEFVRQIVSVWRYGLLWLILAASAVAGWRAFRDRPTAVAWSLLLLHLGVYSLVFLITPWHLQEQFKAALDRLVLHVVPLAGLLIAMHCSAIAAGPGGDARGDPAEARQRP